MKSGVFVVLKKLSTGDRTLFDIPLGEQQKILYGFKEPLNDFERSYYQYVCQMHYVPKWKQMCYNLCAFVMLPFFVVVCLCRGFLEKRQGRCDAVTDFLNMDSMIPPCLLSEYDKISNNIAEANRFALHWQDIGEVCELMCKRPFNCYFVFKVIVKIALYSSTIYRKTPKAIIVHNEYSFTSSILTNYCKKNNIKHIDVMHGEKLFFMRDSFFRYDECYVWDEYYRDLFVSLRAEKNQFKIALPKAMKIDSGLFVNSRCYADYKYYLACNTKEELKDIVSLMLQFESKGFSIKIRPHPRYTDLDYLRTIVDSKYIENNAEVAIEDSLVNAGNVIAVYSTVLYQGFLIGKRVILDDVVYKRQCDILKDLKYIMMNKPHVCLSEEMGKLNSLKF